MSKSTVSKQVVSVIKGQRISKNNNPYPTLELVFSQDPCQAFRKRMFNEYGINFSNATESWWTIDNTVGRWAVEQIQSFPASQITTDDNYVKPSIKAKEQPKKTAAKAETTVDIEALMAQMATMQQTLVALVAKK